MLLIFYHFGETKPSLYFHCWTMCTISEHISENEMILGLAILLFLAFVTGIIMIVMFNSDKIKLLHCVHKQILPIS